MSTFLDWVARLWAPWITENSLQTDVAGHARRLDKLEVRMTNAENAAYDRAAELVGLVKAEFASLHQRIDAAVADKDTAVQAGVQSALAEDSASDAARLNGLLDELASVLPSQVPDVPVPDPGTPAEIPADQPADEAPVEQPADPAVPVEQQQLPDDAA